MLIKLPPIQIPQYWELIKHGALKSDNITDNCATKYSKNLLIKLLSGEYICLLVHKQKQIHAICIIAFEKCSYTKQKVLYLRNVYGIKVVELDEWNEVLRQIKKFAKTEDCYKIYGATNHTKVAQVFEANGIKPSTTIFEYYL